MKKIYMFAVIVFILTLKPIVTTASEYLNLHIFPAKLYINFAEEKVPEGQYLLNYEGTSYVPLRFIAEKLGYGVDYDDRSNTIQVFPSSDF